MCLSAVGPTYMEIKERDGQQPLPAFHSIIATSATGTDAPDKGGHECKIPLEYPHSADCVTVCTETTGRKQLCIS